MKDEVQVNRRDFLYVATGMTAAIGAAFASWPFIDQMRPDASTLAISTIDIDISAIDHGMSVTAQWRGRPIFVRNRTSAEIEASLATPVDALKDPLARNANLNDDAPATDAGRSAGEGRDGLIIMIGVCTHLGCIPLGQAGDFGGWFCPCHGSHYDTAGRIRTGPAPENLAIPRFDFISDAVVRIG